MLQIVVPAFEGFNNQTNTFINIEEQKLVLEHSLISLSKWESKWNKPFLSKENKTTEETIDYIRCMTLTKNVPPEAYLALTSQNIDEIVKYIDAPMSATTIRGEHSISREIVTSELVYYWMILHNIPFECQKWHLNRLFKLIEVCAIKSQPPKKMGRQAIIERNASLNAARRKKLNTTG